MNFKMIGRFLAQIISIEAVFLLPAMGIGLFNGEYGALKGFLLTLAIMVVLASALFAVCRKTEKLFGAREGMVCVSFSWITLSILGCLPFCLSAQTSFINALFEIVSGFTTTGASIFSDVESLPRCFLYWRSFSQWLGGMGVLVFLLAVAPSSGKDKGFTMHLLRAESPGPDVGKLVPKMKQTALILSIMYIVLTVVNLIFLLAGGMSLLDAVCTAFSTVSTGGFGIRNDSMASFSPYIQVVTTVFMLLSGINFSCYYLLLMRQLGAVFKDEELRAYILVVAAAIALIAWNIFNIYGNLADTLRHSGFQVASIMTTSGFSTVDFAADWPGFSQSILLTLMVLGACAGSTSGGIKLARVLLIIKSLRRNIRQVLSPNKVQVVRNNGRAVDEKILDNTNAYLAAYVIIFIASFLIISLDGMTTGTNVSAVLATLNNIGPGIEQVGPMCNFADYSALSKLVLTVDMLVGRLEIFPMLVLLSRSTWRRSANG